MERFPTPPLALNITLSHRRPGRSIERGILFTLLQLVVFLVSLTSPCLASVTVYYEKGQAVLHAATGTATSGAAAYTGAAAYNPRTLNAPSPPGNGDDFQTQFGISLSASTPPGASIMQNAGFFGFSIEMSVVNQVCK